MNGRTKIMLLAIYAAILLVVVSCSVLLEDDDESGDIEDLTGTWKLIYKESLDQDQRFSKDIDPKYDIVIDDVESIIFTAKTQGVEFCGVRMENSIVFEYRYGDPLDPAWVRADGELDNGRMVMFETHYYNDEHWFVCLSVYSVDGRTYVPPTDHPSVRSAWDLREGQSHLYDLTSDDADQYDLSGKRFFISNQRGSLFRAEMQQGTTDQDGKDITITRLMNGVFVSSFGDSHVAFLMDQSGKMWTLTIHDDVAVLRAVVMSEYSEHEGKMVIAERTYFDQVPSKMPDVPDITGTWTSAGAAGTYGDGSSASRDSGVTMELESIGNVFVGYSVSDGVTLAEGGYIVYDPDAVAGNCLIRMGTDLGGMFAESYAVLDGDKLTLIEFVYDEHGDRKNGVLIFEFHRS